MSFSAKRVWVAGGPGFLGSHLCEQPLAAGDEILCVGNSYTGRRRISRTFRLLRISRRRATQSGL
jgi:nucleoside-diphosphate-sugar epimerase